MLQGSPAEPGRWAWGGSKVHYMGAGAGAVDNDYEIDALLAFLIDEEYVEA